MKRLYTIFLILLPVLAACDNDMPTVSLGIDDSYRIARMQKLPLEPALTGRAYRWTVDGTTVSDQRRYIFLADEERTYHIEFEIIDPDTPFHFEFTVDVVHEEVEYSPYIARVYEYRPAPGQFINEMPKYEPGDTEADMVQKAEDCIAGTNDVMISLGGFGGYVTFGFDHTVMNVAGQPDFRIWGNSFYELTQPDRKGGSAEPGIVMVSYDANDNGMPDDPWYELVGSEYHKPTTRHNYTIHYSAPADGASPVPDDSGFLDNIHYIAWSDSEGAEGFMPKNIFHTQPYWPQWLDCSELTFAGTCLAPNAEDISGNGSYYVLYCLDWGYVDNHPNDYADLNSFDIGNAVDADGKPVRLPGADFIRVYTGVNQQCGWLGETSTEICRAQDLHIDNFQPQTHNDTP